MPSAHIPWPAQLDGHAPCTARLQSWFRLGLGLGLLGLGLLGLGSGLGLGLGLGLGRAAAVLSRVASVALALARGAHTVATAAVLADGGHL